MNDQKWNDIARQVENCTDKRGRLIDLKIRPLVIALIGNDFATFFSCQGHLGRQYPYPWVEVGSREHVEAQLAHGREFPPEVATNVRESNIQARVRLMSLLDDFYATEKPPNMIRLSTRLVLSTISGVEPSNDLEAFYICPVHTPSYKTRRRKRLKHYHTEVDRFAAFLKRKG